MISVCDRFLMQPLPHIPEHIITETGTCEFCFLSTFQYPKSIVNCYVFTLKEEKGKALNPNMSKTLCLQHWGYEMREENSRDDVYPLSIPHGENFWHNSPAVFTKPHSLSSSTQTLILCLLSTPSTAASPFYAWPPPPTLPPSSHFP